MANTATTPVESNVIESNVIESVVGVAEADVIEQAVMQAYAASPWICEQEAYRMGTEIGEKIARQFNIAEPYDVMDFIAEAVGAAQWVIAG